MTSMPAMRWSPSVMMEHVSESDLFAEVHGPTAVSSAVMGRVTVLLGLWSRTAAVLRHHPRHIGCIRWIWTIQTGLPQCPTF